MAPNIVVVTGANTGLGYAIVKGLLESSKTYHIYLGSRSAQKGDEAVKKVCGEVPESKSTVELLEIDVSSDESVTKAADIVEKAHGRLDTLVNNAGVGFDSLFTTGQMSLRDSFNKTFDINVASANVVTYTFAPLLIKSSDARLIFLAGIGQITIAAENYFPTPPLPAGWPKEVGFETIAYRSSKVAMNLVMLDWNHKLKEDGVKVWSINPGFCATGLVDGNAETMSAMGAQPASVGAQNIISAIEGNRDSDVGKCLDTDGLLPW
ncbi:NAD(P)-binding protein [Aaosphaeria arxii CBS 175.79]|uniref:NAD(P)-binding protein n=1 Tax=Aaosphaeria arxii CBS 175.79 TaxID=1450172 RepID=A0A6A5XNG8_9PLEO|nr:NAD(P)-binding protein [Aaosphaeria arxii CBS 175.79]KAF2014439.1 NAD(P)-binding protein [Aaosphaeria arxii CBS 175.79]